LYDFRNRNFSACLGLFLTRDPIGLPDGPNQYVAWFVPSGTDPWGLDAVVGITGAHAIIEFEFDLSTLPCMELAGPYPVVIVAEMTGPGYDKAAVLDAASGVEGLLDIGVRPVYGDGGRPLPQASTLSLRYRRFSGSSVDAQRLFEWIDKHTAGSLCESLKKAYLTKPRLPQTLKGAGPFAKYGVPAGGGRQNCATFAGAAMEVYSRKHWLSLFPVGPIKITPETLMLGPKGLPWNSFLDLTLPKSQ
jgi:hypothetical protein